MNEKEEGIWTEADSARADLISGIACEISEDEDLVALVMDTYDRHQPTNGAALALYEALRALLDEQRRGDGDGAEGADARDAESAGTFCGARRRTLDRHDRSRLTRTAGEAMSNLWINWRFGIWFFQMERDFPFRMSISKSQYWVDQYRGEQSLPFFGFYTTFGWHAR